MNFTITARVVSQLGTELISSDEVAIYELVKNGFDAGSSVVEVNINYRVDVTIIRRIQDTLLQRTDARTLDCPVQVNEKNSAISLLATACASDNAQEACVLLPKQLAELKATLEKTTTVREFLRIIGGVNSIDVVES